MYIKSTSDVRRYGVLSNQSGCFIVRRILQLSLIGSSSSPMTSFISVVMLLNKLLSRFNYRIINFHYEWQKGIYIFLRILPRLCPPSLQSILKWNWGLLQKLFHIKFAQPLGYYKFALHLEDSVGFLLEFLLS